MIFYVATTNAGKLRDFRAAAVFFDAQIQPMPGLQEIPAPEEDADSFEGNARIKAEYYSRFMPGELVIADDSGLEVAALGGDPGVHSARFAENAGFYGEGSTDERNNSLLMSKLHRVADRRARYRCWLAVGKNGGVVVESCGVVDGEIVVEPRGDGGFGYDPLFWLPEAGRTMAEVTMEERMAWSHRARALASLLRQVVEAPPGKEY